MQKVRYSELKEEADKYWKWNKEMPVAPVPPTVAREGAGSEARTPIMHYGVVAPVYLAVIRYLKTINPKKGMRLIELGSGSGRMLAYLKTQFPELEVWGVDYSAECIEYSKKAYGKYGVRFKHVSAQDTSFKKTLFDFVISSHVIEHLTKEDGTAFVKETLRLLKKNGYGFIGTPERRRCQELYKKNPTMKKRDRLVPPHEWEYTLPELKSLAQQVFPKNNVKVDTLINPVFHKVFKSSVQKIKPGKGTRRHIVNLGYRVFRDKAPRPVFDRLTRIGASLQMKEFNTSFYDVLMSNSLVADSPYNKRIPDNLLLVCQK